LRLILKTRLLQHFQERLTTANIEGDSLKKSPKYFPASASAPTLGPSPTCNAAQRNGDALNRKTRTRHALATNTDTTLTKTLTEEAPWL